MQEALHVLIIKIVRDLIYTCSASECLYGCKYSPRAPNQPCCCALTSHHIALENTGRGCVLMKNFISDESRKNILPPLPTRHSADALCEPRDKVIINIHVHLCDVYVVYICVYVCVLARIKWAKQRAHHKNVRLHAVNFYPGRFQRGGSWLFPLGHKLSEKSACCEVFECPSAYSIRPQRCLLPINS